MRRIYSIPYQLIKWLLSYSYYYKCEKNVDIEYDAKFSRVISLGDNLIRSEIHYEVLQTILKNAEDK